MERQRERKREPLKTSKSVVAQSIKYIARKLSVGYVAFTNLVTKDKSFIL